MVYFEKQTFYVLSSMQKWISLLVVFQPQSLIKSSENQLLLDNILQQVLNLI